MPGNVTVLEVHRATAVAPVLRSLNPMLRAKKLVNDESIDAVQSVPLFDTATVTSASLLS